MAEFVALYRGRTVSEAQLVAVSAEPRLVGKFFEELMGEKPLERFEEPRDQVVELVPHGDQRG